jgi:Zn-finger nucleic acid-binding protein
MPYRDRPPTCPRCAISLARDGERERWNCSRCAGRLVVVAELVDELLAVDPGLKPEGAFNDVGTISRRGGESLPCAMCGADMEAVFLGGAELERCRQDGVIWFDADELEAVLYRARQLRDDRQVGLLESFLRLFR